MRKFHYLITCSLLIAIGWANALAQESPTVNPAQRLNLELINNQSTFVIDEVNGNRNEYTNTFRLTQPTTDLKLTAGLLKQGDNIITITRSDDQGNSTDFARLNLSADARDTEPFIAVDPTSIQLTGDVPATGQFAFGGWSLNEDVTISINEPGFSVSPSVISPVNHDIEPQAITVTYNGNQDEANATVTITSEAGIRTVAVSYKKDTGGIVGSIDFLNDYTPPTSGAVAISVPAPWSISGQLGLQSNGYAFTTAGSSLDFTVPSGYANATMTLVIEIGPDAGDYLVINTSAYTVEAGYAYYIPLTGINSGDVISIFGASYQNGSWSQQYSPDIGSIIIYEGEVSPPNSAPRRGLPPLRVKAPAIAIAPTISYWDEETQTWSTASSLAASKIYQPNEAIDLEGLGNIVDQFSAPTDDNTHSTYYTYRATLDADILIPEGGSGGYDFYASIDFNQCTSADISAAVFTDLDNWTWRYAAVYNGAASNNTYCGYIVNGGNITYYVPNTFIGNTVAVTVTTGIGQDGAGKLIVNGVLHEFGRPGSTYTWNVPVSANGSVIITPDENEEFSVDLAKIEVRGVNNASMHNSIKVLKQPTAIITQFSTYNSSSDYKQIKR